VLLPAGRLDVVRLTSQQVAGGRLSACKAPLTPEQRSGLNNSLLPNRLKAIILKQQGTITQVSGHSVQFKGTPVVSL
jgi:hypothetical protein